MCFYKKTIKPGDCVFICNVNNPTSVLHDKKQLLSLVVENPNVQFVVDETYLLFRNDFAKQSLMGHVREHDNLHVVVSLSKFFSTAGLRLGIFVSNINTINIYNEQFYIPYSVNPFNLISLDYLIRDKEFIFKTREVYYKESKRLFVSLSKRLAGRLLCFEPDGSFIIGRILTGQKSQEVKSSLEKMGITIRGGHELLDMSDDWIRFSVRSIKDNNLLIKELDNILKK